MSNTTQNQSQALTTAKTFPDLLERFKGEVRRALPTHLNADRMCRIALTEFRKNPKLSECDPKSVFAAVIMASQVGLEPGLMGQAYLIPYKSRNGYECQFIPGYQGLVDLVRRSGAVKRIEAHIVRAKDRFVYKTGLHTVLEHEPYLDGDAGELRLAYAVAEFKDGGEHVEVMTKDQIEKIRDASNGYKNAVRYNSDNPWITNTDEMWRKTVVRRICKYLPKSAQLALAVALDDAAVRGAQKVDIDDAIDATWAPVAADPEPKDEADKTATERAASELADKLNGGAKAEPQSTDEGKAA